MKNTVECKQFVQINLLTFSLTFDIMTDAAW